uniref:Uncharacterized protein n=1 Tax=Pyricularia oryzae (strain P131) TaxID=1143193 RepID=L7JLR1_PYRO1
MESLSTVEAYPRSSGTQTAVVLMLSTVRVSGSTLPVVAMVAELLGLTPCNLVPNIRSIDCAPRGEKRTEKHKHDVKPSKRQGVDGKRGAAHGSAGQKMPRRSEPRARLESPATRQSSTMICVFHYRAVGSVPCVPWIRMTATAKARKQSGPKIPVTLAGIVNALIFWRWNPVLRPFELASPSRGNALAGTRLRYPANPPVSPSFAEERLHEIRCWQMMHLTLWLSSLEQWDRAAGRLTRSWIRQAWPGPVVVCKPRPSCECGISSGSWDLGVGCSSCV